MATNTIKYKELFAGEDINTFKNQDNPWRLYSLKQLLQIQNNNKLFQSAVEQIKKTGFSIKTLLNNNTILKEIPTEEMQFARLLNREIRVKTYFQDNPEPTRSNKRTAKQLLNTHNAFITEKAAAAILFKNPVQNNENDWNNNENNKNDTYRPFPEIIMPPSRHTKTDRSRSSSNETIGSDLISSASSFASPRSSFASTSSGSTRVKKPFEPVASRHSLRGGKHRHHKKNKKHNRTKRLKRRS